jgi:dipeptidyl aminopeptidase/acylaminoacyl peptidase
LAARGIAALLVPPRGDPQATLADRAEDALAAVAFLRQRPEIDQEKVGLAGHSLGGMVAPLAASRSDQVAFVILLAAPSAPLADLTLALLEGMLRENGATEAELDTFRKAERQATAWLREGKSLGPLRQELLKVY